MGGFVPLGQLAVGLIWLALASSMAQADAVSDFYAGKTMTLIVSADAAGTYSQYARLLARHLSKYVPGRPAVNVQNMPGAGGLVGANYLYNVASKDGLSLGAIQNTVPFEPYYGTKEARFDALKFIWVGNASEDTPLFMLWHTVPANNIEEAQKQELILGASGINSQTAFYTRVFQVVFNLKVKMISGYQGNTEVDLAMERGENQGNASRTWTALKVSNRDWIEKKLVKFLFQYGAHPNPELEDIPFAADLVSDPNDKLLVNVASAPFAVSKPVLMPPGVPDARAAAVRSAVLATYRDADYLADCAKQGLDCGSPMAGEEVARFLQRAYLTPAAIRDRLTKMYGVGK